MYSSRTRELCEGEKQGKERRGDGRKQRGKRKPDSDNSLRVRESSLAGPASKSHYNPRRSKDASH